MQRQHDRTKKNKPYDNMYYLFLSHTHTHTHCHTHTYTQIHTPFASICITAFKVKGPINAEL